MWTYRAFLFLWLLLIPVKSFAIELLEDCIPEPIFKGEVCTYSTNSSSNKTVLLIHGIGDNASRDWDEQLELLSPEYRIVTFDLPGFGRSEQGDKDYTPEKYIKLIDYITTYYSANEFDLIGHSMGGALSLLYTSKYPEKVEKLVLVDVAGILHRLAIGKYMIASGFNGGAEGTDRIESYIVKVIEKFERLFSFLRDDVAKQSEHARAGIELVDFDFSQNLEKVSAPTLIIWGEDDLIAPLRTAKVLDYRLKNSELHIIKDAGHVPMKEKREEFNALLHGFLVDAKREPTKVNTENNTGKTKFGSCIRESGVVFRGEYERIDIINCSNVLIMNADVNELFLFESRAVVENSRIGGDVAIAVESIGSDVKVTSTEMRGNVVLKAERSRFDFAAVDIYPKEHFIVGVSKSRFIFSVSQIVRPDGAEKLHKTMTVNANERL